MTGSKIIIMSSCNTGRHCGAFPTRREGALVIEGCGSKLLTFSRKFREAQQTALDGFESAQGSGPVSTVTLCAWGRMAFQYVTNLIMHNAENALGFWGNGRYVLLSTPVKILRVKLSEFRLNWSENFSRWGPPNAGAYIKGDINRLKFSRFGWLNFSRYIYFLQCYNFCCASYGRIWYASVVGNFRGVHWSGGGRDSCSYKFL